MTCNLHKLNSFRDVVRYEDLRPSRYATRSGWNRKELAEEARKLSAMCNADGNKTPVILEVSSVLEGGSMVSGLGLEGVSISKKQDFKTLGMACDLLWVLDRLGSFNAENIK
jgi:hypothetical protein